MKTVLKIVLFFAISALISTGLYFVAKKTKNTSQDEAMKGKNGLEAELQVPLQNTIALRETFEKELRGYLATHKDYELRPLYEEYIDEIGANGIIDTILKVNALCHFEEHDLGKLIYSRVGTIGESLATCAESCYSGCMHGVFMEAFKSKQEKYLQTLPESEREDNEHISLEVAKESIPSICTDPGVSKAYRPGDCAHGVGHALMYLSKYKWKDAINACNLFTDKKLAYYCATGAYMEYVGIKDEEDAKDPTKNEFYPCDQGEYPAACFFSKVGQVIFRNQEKGLKLEATINRCLLFSGMYQSGCFHGVGNTFMEKIVEGKISIQAVCNTGETGIDKILCLEGAMMRMGKYHYDAGKEICMKLRGESEKVCFNANEQRMYGLDRPFDLYIN